MNETTKKPSQIAAENLHWLQENPYPGRILFIGVSGCGNYLIQGYAITGRSEGSRNRVLTPADRERVFTEPADPRKESGDPALTIYDAMLTGDGSFVVSNGRQTTAVASRFRKPLSATLDNPEWSYEPDPSHTPRITGAQFLWEDGSHTAEIAILKKAEEGEACDRRYFSYKNIPRGFGYLISTYEGDGNPLPAYQGEPRLIPLSGDIRSILNTYWEALPHKHRVAIAAKFIPISGDPSLVMRMNAREKVEV